MRARLDEQQLGHPQEGLLRGPSVFLGYLDAEHDEAAFEDGWYGT